MDKLAQNRSLRSKVWESVNLSGKALESLHPEVQETMERMREVDTKVREIANDVRSLMRAARSANRTRDYLGTAYNLAAFHTRCKHIAHYLLQFANSVDIKHYQFLLNNFEDPHKSELFEYDPNAKITAACLSFEELTKESNFIGDGFRAAYDFIGDTGSNLFSQQGRTRRLMEKRFTTDFIKKIRSQTDAAYNHANQLFKKLLAAFSTLESGISRRNINLYVDTARRFAKDYDAFHKTFEKYYTEVITPLKKYQEDIQNEEKRQKEEAIKQQPQKEHEEYQQRVIEDAEKLEEANKDAPSAVNPFTFEDWKRMRQETGLSPDELLDKLNKEWGKEDEVGEEVNIEELEHPKRPLKPNNPNANEDEKNKYTNMILSHYNFLDKITKNADDNNEQAFIAEVLNYSEKLEEQDEVMSSELLQLANNIILDKQAGIFDIFKKKEEEQVQKVKPLELSNEEENRFKAKTIDLADGRIDRAFSNIPALSGISGRRIHVSPAASSLIINHIIRRLSRIADNADLSKYASEFERRLIPVLKEAIVNGWVISASEVSDQFNPNDKFLEIYIRLNLEEIHPELAGIAKMRVSCRLSAEHGTLAIRNVQRNFEVEVPNEEEELDSGDIEPYDGDE